MDDPLSQVPADATPAAMLDSFLRVHAQRSALPVALLAKGEALYHRLCNDPPAIPAWGRFLVAMGTIAANDLDDAAAASRYFLLCLQQAERHGDHEAAVTSGYNQGVLHERRRNPSHARAAYRAAAMEGFRLEVEAANTLRCAVAAVRLAFAEHEQLDPPYDALAKQAWLGWIALRQRDPQQLDAGLIDELQRQMCALLLPEDDPLTLAAAWRQWAPATLWKLHDGAAEVLAELFTLAAESADRHLRDEGPDPGAPYRQLAAAARR